MATLTAYANANYAHPDAAGGAWVDPTNAYADDTTYATRTGTVKNTWYGNLFGFDLSSLPAGATLSSVVLEAQWHNSLADAAGPVLGLCAYYNGAAVGAETADTTGQLADELVNQTPTGLTVAQLKTTGATGFAAGVRFRRTDNTAHIASLDYAKVTVTYTDNRNGTAAISGNGSTTGEVKKTGLGAALTTAAGLLAAVGFAAMLGLASISGGGALAATGIKGGAGIAAISGNGTITATGIAGGGEEHSGTAAISGNGTLSGTGVKAASGVSPAISGNGAVTGAGAKQAIVSASISGGGNTSATGLKTGQSTAAIFGNGTINLQGIKHQMENKKRSKFGPGFTNWGYLKFLRS